MKIYPLQLAPVSGNRVKVPDDILPTIITIVGAMVIRARHGREREERAAKSGSSLHEPGQLKYWTNVESGLNSLISACQQSFSRTEIESAYCCLIMSENGIVKHSPNLASIRYVSNGHESRLPEGGESRTNRGRPSRVATEPEPDVDQPTIDITGVGTSGGQAGQSD